MAPKRFERGLDDRFMALVQRGPCEELLRAWKAADLDVRIRHNQLTAYDGGRAVGVLTWAPRVGPRLAPHHKYLRGTALEQIPPDSGTAGDYPTRRVDERLLRAYLKELPMIRANARKYAGREEEWESELIRQNTGSSCWLIDRQVQVPGVRRKADLVGLSLAPSTAFVVIEVKAGLDNTIQKAPDQLRRYIDILAPGGRVREDVVTSYRTVVRQRRELGFPAPSEDLIQVGLPVEAVLALCAYNQRSELLGRARDRARALELNLGILQFPERSSLSIGSRSTWDRL